MSLSKTRWSVDPYPTKHREEIESKRAQTVKREIKIRIKTRDRDLVKRIEEEKVKKS